MWGNEISGICVYHVTNIIVMWRLQPQNICHTWGNEVNDYILTACTVLVYTMYHVVIS